MVRIITPELFVEAEDIIASILERHSLVVQQMGYHSYFSQQAYSALSHINTPTAQYIRTLADRLAIQSLTTRAFQVEIKDIRNPIYDNIAMEAFPLLIHRTLYLFFGVQCLYVFVFGQTIKACWVEALPITEVIIPKRLQTMEAAYWKPLFSQLLPNARLKSKPTGGSGDPFVLMLPKDIDTLPSLESILDIQLKVESSTNPERGAGR